MTRTATTRPVPLRLRGGLALVLVLVGLALTAALPVAAHEYWLAPSRYLRSPNRPIELSALAGTGFRGERKPFAPAHCERLSVHATRTLDLTPVAREGGYTWARFAPSDSGGAMFAFESDFTPITLPAATFDAYLATEGLAGPRTARAKDPRLAASPGRERFRRCAKAWVSGNDATRATTPVGLPLEIVPGTPPGQDEQLKLRVLWQGQPLAGAMVRVWHTAAAKDESPTDPESRDSLGVAWQQRTDAQGAVTLPTQQAGEWLVSTVHMVPSSNTAIADWESTWASLTFQRRRAVTR